MTRSRLVTVLFVGVLIAALAPPRIAGAQADPPEPERAYGAGLIFTYAPQDYVVIGSEAALTVVSLRAPHHFTLFGPDQVAALLDSAADDGSPMALAEAFAASFGSGEMLDLTAAETVERADGAALLIPFSREGMTGAVLLARFDDGRGLIAIGTAPDTTAAVDLNAEIAALLASIRFAEPVTAASDGLIALGEPMSAAFALPEGFRAIPADTTTILLDSLPDPALYVQVTVRLNVDASMTPELWKTQFFAGLAERAGDDAYDPQSSWTALTDGGDAARVEVYRAIGLDDELSALGYLITLSPDAFVVISAQAPDAAALQARADALDALALSVRPLGGE